MTGTLRSLWARGFNWSTISHWLMILCLWAVCAQLTYPTLDSFHFIGWLNASILALCALTWVLRFFVRKDLTTGPGIIPRSLLAVDVVVLLFIAYGVLLNVNGVVD